MRRPWSAPWRSFAGDMRQWGMFRLFLSSLGRYLALIWQALSAPFLDGRRWHGVLLLWLLLPLFLLLQLVHWFGFLLDEILFRGYRRVEVREPLFVLGPPRSGTTHLHNVLALDGNRTTFRAWECLFALSVSARRLLLGLAWLDARLGRPLGRLIRLAERRLLASMDDVHPIRLDSPEEDFLALMPLAQCFLLLVPFPRAKWLWRTARLDRDFSPAEKRRLLGWYRRCIQKHLYVHGPEQQFLSKNASFAGMAQALLEEFPDARILCCMREPARVVPSQLSSLRPGLKACGFDGFSAQLRDALVDLLAFYYRNLADVAERHPGRMAVLHNQALHDRLEESIRQALEQIGRPLSEAFAGQLARAAVQSRGFRSGHRYTPAEFGLDEARIESLFEPLYRRFAPEAAGDGASVREG